MNSRGEKIIILLLLIALFFSCDNPFFVPTGEPVITSGFRATPRGVIRQLSTAYEHKRLDLFTDLLIESQFRFYIAPNSADSLIGVRSYVKLDTSLSAKMENFPEIRLNTRHNKYYYWGYDKERLSHQNLFSRAERINFFPQLEATKVTFITDSVFTDSLKNDYVVDTILAEVVAERARLEISAPQIQVTFDIGKQVFYMIKDPADPSLWAIVKWFDLGS